MNDEREQQGLRRPFTRQEISHQSAVKGDERPGTESHMRAEQKLADMQGRRADYRPDWKAWEMQRRPADGDHER